MNIGRKREIFKTHTHMRERERERQPDRLTYMKTEIERKTDR